MIQGLGGPDEDRRGGFQRGGWVATQFDDEAMAVLSSIYQRADAFLFGRWTYDTFAASWGAMADSASHPVADALHNRPKYVVSTTLTEPQWADTTVLSRDPKQAITELKSNGDGEIQVHGSVSLVRWLLEHQLVDELILLTAPVIIGQGTRLFPQDGPDIALHLVETKVTPAGVAIQAYRPLGVPEYATATAHNDG